MEKLYFEYENGNLESHEIVKGLYGSEIDINRACGFCIRHDCYLTVKMLRQHDCLKKQCHHLVKNENHFWWQQRAMTKAKRQERKERISTNRMVAN